MPADAYGVGSSLIRGENDFTADVVVADGKPAAKVGRRLRPNDAARTRQLTTAAASGPGQETIGSVERTRWAPASAKRANAASASSV